jgi:hypothetical protein
MVGAPAKYDYVELNVGNGRSVMTPDPREPLYWLYSKPGIRERLHFLRTETDFQTPEDVSEDYLSHMEAEERVLDHKADGQPYFKWIQHKDRNDLFVCECYFAMQVEQSGMTLMEISRPQPKT